LQVFYSLGANEQLTGYLWFEIFPMAVNLLHLKIKVDVIHFEAQNKRKIAFE